MMPLALVTGAGHGIGAACAKALARDGYRVAVHYHARADEAKQLAMQLGNDSFAVQADIGTEAGVASLFAALEGKGQLRALVNNAAYNNGAAPVSTLDWKTVEKVFAVNVLALFACCREGLARMQPGGSIVNVSSEAGKFGGNRMAPYASSKAAVNTFTLAFAREAASVGVRVNAVSPGVIDTGVHPAERLDALKASIPLGRLGTAEEVAEAVAWLVSEKSAYVSGAVLPVTGAR